MNKLPALTRNRDFQKVYNKGRYAASFFLVVYALNNSLNITRLGITASRKIGNAVMRNRMRRIIRENIRVMKSSLINGVDLVIVARKAEKPVSFERIGRELRYLLNKLKLLDSEKEC